MAYLYQRKDGRVEVREARATERGPRSYTLASFRGPLTEPLLDRAASAARRPFDRERLRRAAAEKGIPVARADAGAQARALIAALRDGAGLDPVLVGVLREQLAAHAAATVPEELADAVEWIGADPRSRGRTLRDLLRLYGRIGASPDAATPVARAPRPRIVLRSQERDSA